MVAAWHQTRGYETSVEIARRWKSADTTIAEIERNSIKPLVKKSAQEHERAAKQFHPRQVSAPLPPNRLRASAIFSAESTAEDAVLGGPSEYSQRKAGASTPGPAQNPLLSLAHSRYGLPERLVSNLASMGVHAIYPWQASCLLGRGLLTGQKNLVYTAPTGGGKSLVADLLLLKRIIENPSQKAMLVLPYVALVQEKLKWLAKVVHGVSKNTDLFNDIEHAGVPRVQWKPAQSAIRVAGFFGGSKATATWPDFDVAVCTIERANSLVNTAIEDGKIDQLGVVVIDELHMLDDESRGYIMELMMTKLISLQHGIQIVGMSATLSNPQRLASWLEAKFYVSTYRPIPVEEFLVYENAIYPTANAFRIASQLHPSVVTEPQASEERRIERSYHPELDNPVSNAVVSLALETATSGYGALVFCSSRQGSQATALLISEATPTEQISAEMLDSRMDVLASLQALPSGFEPMLSKTILRGFAFHHAGLTVEERDVVAEAYDQGTLKVMVATCSLAAGINLPARRVILSGARMGRDLVGPAMLRQMRGRAGRKGKDEVGETYLCCQQGDLEAVAELLEAEMPPVESCLTTEKRGIQRALLEVVTIRLANSRDSIDDYIRRSLLYQTTEHSIVLAMVETALQNLLNSRLIDICEYGSLVPTKLGQAIVASALTPEDGIFVHDELRRALESFVMDGEMHIFYLFTPVHTASLSDISWPIFRDQLDSLDESGMRAIRCVGINPASVNKLANSGGTLKEKTAEETRVARIYRRAYSAFQLRDLCNEVSVHQISMRYSVPRGSVQNLAQTCHGFAAGMIKFCERMGWGMLAAVLDHMVDRLKAGARADLLEMTQVAYVKSRMARVLWENGLKSVRALAEAEAQDLVPIMMQAQSSKLRLQGEAADRLRRKLLAKAEIIVSSANRLWEKQQVIEFDE